MNAKLFTAILTVATTSTTSAQTPATISWHDSLQVINKLISLHPDSTDLRLKKAAVNIELGQWEYAAEEYGRILAGNPKNLAARYYRAYTLVHLRQYGQARNDYEQLLAMAPLHFEGRMALASVLQMLNRITDARDQLNQLVQLFPDSAMAYAARATFETEQKEYDTALFDWDEAIRRQPGNADFVVSKADILIKLGRNNDARQTLQQAIDNGIPRYALKEWIEKVKS